MKNYRTNGAIGALLDEYEKAMLELISIIENITPHELTSIVDPDTKDPDCRSIQTILTHVVRSGYNYIVEIRKWLGEEIDFVQIETLQTVEEYQDALLKMFQYNVQFFDDYPAIKLEELIPEKKITVRWGQQFDVEQLMEHAIVHILRHRRQIERFLIILYHRF